MDRRTIRASERDKTPQRWTLLQRFLGYALLSFSFLGVLIYVAQSIEMKNVAYAFRDLNQEKHSLIAKNHRFDLQLMENQSLEKIETLLEKFSLPLQASSRLEIILPVAPETQSSEGQPWGQEDKDSWRSWLYRMNRAQALISTGNANWATRKTSHLRSRSKKETGSSS